MQRYKKWDLLSESTPNSLKEIENVLLKNRGIITQKEKQEFLNPPNPDTISLEDVKIDQKEIKSAIKRIKQAKENKEEVIVYGDYDVDGVCATAILWETLYKAKLKVLPFIPNRFNDGYGLNPITIQTLKEKNKNLSLIITVDNGIVAHEALKEAKKLGIDVIVTDHHTTDDKKLEAKAVVHSTAIAGAAVSYFFAREIIKKFKLKSNDHIELAALGTVSDQMSLTGVNRSIVWHGLRSMAKTKRKGLSKLIEYSKVDGDIATYDINFKIGPRINAAGRLEDATDALRLLCSSKNTTILAQVQKLESLNSKRQRIVEEVLQKATENLGKREDVVVVAANDLHEGVIGLAASKLTEVFYRPSIVMSINGDIAKASARSIKGFNIIEAIREIDHLILQGGGHEMAAGFSIEKKNIQEFRDKIIENASKKITKDLLESGLKIDSQIPFDLIDWDLVNLVEKMQPFGIGNPTPVFATADCEVDNIKTVGSENKHLKFKVKKNGKDFDCIAFGMGGLAEKLLDAEKIGIAYTVEKNEWNGRESIQFKIKDFTN